MAKNCIRRFFSENEKVAESDREALKYKAYTETVLATLWGKNDFMDKILINESGLYQMILESKQPVAKEFKRWVVHEVIPSIRKHGGYILGQERLEDPAKLHKQIEELQAEVEKQTAGKAMKYSASLESGGSKLFVFKGESKMKRPKLLGVKPLEGHILELTYENRRKKRRFDVTPYIKGPWFGELENMDYFNQVFVGEYTVEWPNGQDLCPDELYEYSTPVK